MAKKQTSYFSPKLFKFLRDLAKNNNRDWFQANKARYEDELKEPSLGFISDFGPLLEKISPHFSADPRPVGGSLFRIYRDTRFSKDKTPYKTTAGIHFRHKKAKDAHAPGFYLHLAPGDVFMGAGIWHPDGTTLRKIRSAIAADGAKWKRARNAKRLVGAGYELAGESLKRAPKGIDPEHPLIEDLRRKDFMVVKSLTQKAVTQPGFMGEFASECRNASPLVKYLCGAVGVEY